jgi:hypothetical protein
MAAAKAVPTVPDMNSTTFRAPYFEAVGTVAIDASPATYTLGGIACSLALPLVKAQRAPKNVDVFGKAGYIYRYIPGTNVTNGKLMIFAQTNAAAEDAPLGELADNSAIPAACSGDTITFKAEFLGML